MAQCVSDAVAILYASGTGKTRKIATLIRDSLGESRARLLDIDDTAPGVLAAFDHFIMGSPTASGGALPEAWQRFTTESAEDSLEGKVVAVFGLGNAERYPRTFVDAMGLLADWAEGRGAKMVGRTMPRPHEGLASAGLNGGQMVGLAVDESCTDEEVQHRVQQWALRLVMEFELQSAVAADAQQ